jgi:glutamate-ammonia-ligase adenylyltransferase
LSVTRAAPAIFDRLPAMEHSAPMNTEIEDLPEDLRAPVSRWVEHLSDRYEEGIPEVFLPTVLRLVGISEFAAQTLLRHWPEICGRLEEFDTPVELAPLVAFASDIGESDASMDEVKAALRKRRNLQFLHILWREASGDASVGETLTALSETADQLLRAAADFAVRGMRERFGNVRDDDGETVPLVILGMGKLGGSELNFSSDIDIIFCYPESGESDGRKSLHAQEYFDRLSRRVVSLLDDVTADGFVFRTDTRLRPFGESGPPVVSFTALESYLLQHGRDWERYAYVKARVVGPQPTATIVRELFQNLISPFVYRRYLDFGVFESLREMYEMVSAEVQRRDLVDNVKLGPGGIREIEFIVQSFQLVRGGSRPELQSPALQSVLPLLVDGRAISRANANALIEAYSFLRRLENFIQAIRDKQTHELPTGAEDRARLCLAMGFEDWNALLAVLDKHRSFVTQQFEEIAFRGAEKDVDNSLRHRVDKLWEAAASVDVWQKTLEEAGFVDAKEIASDIIAFQSARQTRQLRAKASDRLQEFIPRLLGLAREKDRSAIAVSRVLGVLEKILRRSAYLALLNENRLAAERLVDPCERSAYIADEIARHPVLLDELLDPALLEGPVSKDELRAEFAGRLRGDADDDSEVRMELLAQFQRASMFRIAVADFNGSLPIMKVSDSLTFLAEAVLEEALATAWRDLVLKYGAPHYEVDGERHAAGFGIVAYGKLGGLELSYGSDLDIVFLHDSKGTSQTTDGDKSIDNAIFFQRLVRRLVHFLTTHTNSGVLYEIDTRLRPSGRKGMLVSNTEAFERYQDENAWTWEHQALLRARSVAGSAAVGKEFERIRAETLTNRVNLDTLRNDVLDMRSRMRKELDKSNATQFDLKQGVGGVGDIEFLVQYLVIKHVREDSSVIEFSDNIRQLDALIESGAVTADTAAELQEIYRQYRLRQHHLALNDEPPIVATSEFVAERAAVSKVWNHFFETE